MKIYYFSGATLPSDTAQSVHVMKMCAAFTGDAKENAVTLFAKGGEGVGDEEIFEYYGVDPVFSLVLPQNPKIPVVTGILRVLGHKWALEEAGLPDLAYGRDPVELDNLVPERVWTVYEVHQMPTSILQSWAIRNLLKRRRLAALVFISEALKKDFVRKFPLAKKHKILVAHDGADVPIKELVAKELPGRSDALKVGYAGSLHQGKGMEVIAVLAKEAPGFDFHVLGGSAEQVKQWQARYLPGNLFMHGHVPHGEIGNYFAALDVLIAPYRPGAKAGSGRDISRWMSPLKIFEYMAAKKPVLASDLPVIREVLTDGENALLVSPSDPKAWIAALKKLEDKALRQGLVERAFADLEQKYSWKKRARTILKFVENG